MATTQPRPKAAPRARLEARITPEQKAVIERAAALQGQSLTDFLVQSAQAAAEEVIRTRQIMVLTERDTAALVEALLNPPPLNEKLRRALRRHDEMIEERW